MLAATTSQAYSLTHLSVVNGNICEGILLLVLPYKMAPSVTDCSGCFQLGHVVGSGWIHDAGSRRLQHVWNPQLRVLSSSVKHTNASA